MRPFVIPTVLAAGFGVFAALVTEGCGSSVSTSGSGDASLDGFASFADSGGTKSDGGVSLGDGGASGDAASGGTKSDGGVSLGDGGASGDAASNGSLAWYRTCGYPSCPAPPDGAVDDTKACAPKGSPCTVAGQTCGTASDANCGSTFVCAAKDPTTTMPCPISSRTQKEGIRYLSESELQKLHDETLRTRLASYEYKKDRQLPEGEHLGFIIEDQPNDSPAVRANREQVDLYGYVSMVVATMQVQEKELARLREEVRLLRAKVKKTKGLASP
jgi:hypothetical protein